MVMWPVLLVWIVSAYAENKPAAIVLAVENESCVEMLSLCRPLTAGDFLDHGVELRVAGGGLVLYDFFSRQRKTLPPGSHRLSIDSLQTGAGELAERRLEALFDAEAGVTASRLTRSEDGTGSCSLRQRFKETPQWLIDCETTLAGSQAASTDVAEFPRLPQFSFYRNWPDWPRGTTWLASPEYCGLHGEDGQALPGQPEHFYVFNRDLQIWYGLASFPESCRPALDAELDTLNNLVQWESPLEQALARAQTLKRAGLYYEAAHELGSVGGERF